MRRRTFGFGLRTDAGTPNFTMFGVTIHYHPKHDPDGCPFRYGLIIELLGMGVAVGIFQK